jgi:hypothetical protein
VVEVVVELPVVTIEGVEERGGTSEEGGGREDEEWRTKMRLQREV